MNKQGLNYCIIVAGGSGIRMGSEIPKQFIELNGKPVLMHTIEKFYLFDPNMQLVVVLPIDQQTYWKELCEKHKFGMAHTIANGGITRFHSVKNALEKVENDATLIAVHDGVRPLVSTETIKRCIDVATEQQTAIPVISVNDSVREVTEAGSKPVDRSKLKLVQTPQVFNASLLKKAYQSAFRPEFTDDASVVEYEGATVTLVEGNTENIKITHPSDISIAETLLHTQKV